MKIAKAVIGGGRLLGAIHEASVVLFELGTQRRVAEYPLFDDTNSRVSLSGDDRWLVIGSWRHGIKVFDLENKSSFALPKVRGMADLDQLNRRREVCCGSNKNSGFEIVSFEKKEVTKSSSRYERIIEVPSREEHLAFAFGEEKVFVLDCDFEVKWSWEWESFCLCACAFNGFRVLLAGTSGKLVLLDLEKKSVVLSTQSNDCFGYAAVAFAGDAIIALASEYKGTERSALLRLNDRLEVEKVLGEYPPPIFDCVVVGEKLVDRSGRIVDVASGEELGEMNLC